MPNPPTCSACRWFHRGPTTANPFANRPDDGECRRHPPGLDNEVAASPGWRVWPAVFDDDWCGGFDRIGPGEACGPRQAGE
ncbi:hypothetical protein [Methylobacterium sp. ID0610]|uniref:hypothetical protein n=1 Tax=Methylobacterium carpenticola TaxID=3344827 RepID=UPI0036A9F72A